MEEKLKQELLEKEGFSSYKEVQIWLKAVEGIELSSTQVHHVDG